MTPAWFKSILLFLYFTHFVITGRASHIVGGEISYQCLGNGNYQIVLKVYRDCFNGIAGFDDPASVSVYDASGTLTQTFLMYSPVINLIPPVISSPCFTAPGNICVEEGIYTATVNLPPIPGGYSIAYQRCCRNNSIVNLIDPGYTGSTYVATIPDPQLSSCNSSATFSELPPMYICEGVPFTIDYGAQDPDGDSLVYELCDPVIGADQNDPMPSIASPPPYNPVTWASGYSSSYPMASAPPISIDPATGMLSGTATALGQFVVAVCVSEYRNGILVTTGRRDYQFNVVPCPNLVNAAITPQITLNNGDFCQGSTFSFINSSSGGSSYHWDFGLSNTPGDTSNLFQPSFTYPDTGTYTVTLIVNPGPCSDTTTETFMIHQLLDPLMVVSPGPQCLTGNSWDLWITGSYESYAQFHWSINGNNYQGDSLNGLSFALPGIYSVLMVAHQAICKDTLVDTLIVVPDVTSMIQPVNNLCQGTTLTLFSNSIHATELQWDFGVTGVNTDTSSLVAPIYTFPDTGTYTITLIASSGGLCIDSTQLVLDVNPVLDINAWVSDTAICLAEGIDVNVTGSFTSQVSIAWEFGQDATPATTNQPGFQGLYYQSAGVKEIIVYATEFGCVDSDWIAVNVYPFTTADFSSYPNHGCVPLETEFTATTQGSYPVQVVWNFGDGHSGAGSPAKHSYQTAGLYSVQMLAYTNYGCTDTIEVVKADYILALPTPEAVVNLSTYSAPMFNPTVHFEPISSAEDICWTDYGDGSSDTSCTPTSHSYSEIGTYPITYIVTNEFGCTDTLIRAVEITAEIDIYFPNTFTPNGDGANEVFYPKGMGITSGKLLIYDRWGEKIFETDRIFEGWSGDKDGIPVPEGVYAYQCNYVTIFGRSLSAIGHVNLIR